MYIFILIFRHSVLLSGMSFMATVYVMYYGDSMFTW